MEATPGRAKEAAPQDRDGGRINFAIGPANRAFPEDETTTRAAGGETTLKDAPLIGAVAAPLSRGVAGQTKGGQSAVTTMRTETGRIPVFTDLAKIPAVRPALVLNRKAPRNQGVMDTIPKPLCWALLASSIAILLIEIWNYIR
jgi:hypothetical protein